MKPIMYWPGSKWRIAKWIISHFPQHRTYLEPFFGSGAVFFKKDPSSIETINDLDDDVVNLFRTIRNNPEDLKKLLFYTPFSRTEYNLAHNSTASIDDLERARIFLLKSMQSYGYRQNENAGWKSDVVGRESSYALRHWNALPELIDKVVERLKSAQIENQDAIKLINRYNNEKILIYLDPPYLMSTRYRKQYKKELYEDSEHIELLEAIIKSKSKIIISGYESELYDTYLKDWKKDEIKSRALNAKQRVETIWMNYSI